MSSTETGTAATEPIATAPLSTVFCADDADVVIRVAGTTDFRVHKLILSLASPIFKDMFTVPQPPSDTLPHVDVHESAETWENILRTIYPMQNPIIDSQEEFGSLLLAATKYEMQYIIDLHKKGFENPTFIQQDPLHLYAIACACGLDDQAKYVARRTQLSMVTRRSNAGDLKGLTVESYHQLVSFLFERDTEWHRTIDRLHDYCGDYCGCDRQFKNTLHHAIKMNLKDPYLKTEGIYLLALEDVPRCQESARDRGNEREGVCDRLLFAKRFA